jgi:lantibiotic modifying enzyme
MKMKWEKIIVDSKNREVLQKISEIFKCLLKNINSSNNNIGLLSGKTGIALFLYYYSKLLNKIKFADQGYEFLFDVFDEINQGFNYHIFCS